MPIVVLVPGYGGRLRAVERWRMSVATRTLVAHGGGSLVLSGDRGEAERLAALASGSPVVLETRARSTWENVALSLPHLEGAEAVAVATDPLHARRAGRYLRQLHPDLGRRLVTAEVRWWNGTWIQIGAAIYEALLALRIAVRGALRRSTGGR